MNTRRLILLIAYALSAKYYSYNYYTPQIYNVYLAKICVRTIEG
jgi:hypothetical protein